MREAAVAELLNALADVDTVDRVYAVLLDKCMASCRARRGAVIQRDTADVLHVVAGVNANLPDQMVIGDVRARLWAVLLGRSVLFWSPDDVPEPFRGVAGWETGVVVRLAARSGHARLLVLADSDDPDRSDTPKTWCDDVTVLADVTAPVIDNIGLLAAAGRARTLLRRVTALAGQLTTADSPEELLNRLVDGLVAIDPILGATVWSLQDGGNAALALAGRHRAGTSTDAILDHPDVRRRVVGMLRPDTAPAIQQLLGDVAEVPGGGLLTLLPIPQSGRLVLGVLHPAPLEADSKEVFSTLVGSIGPALRQARMGGERRSLVAGLSDVLRPHGAPPALDIGVEHHPNTTAAEAFGGDFYDWFQPSPDRVLVAMGDVAGKGIPAAAAASMTVWSLRALGRQGPTPATLVHLLDQVVGAQLGDDRFVTLCLIDIDTSRWTVRMVLAGHPAPMLLGGGEPLPDTPADRPLGTWPEGPAFITHEFKVSPGQVLLLFTDGITEAASETGERIGRDVVQAAAESAYRDAGGRPSEVAAQVWSRVHAWASGPPDDDCAIIALRRPL